MPSVNRKQMASVFDIIGPAMVGPSSSHTAGALRIALMARRLVESRITRVSFTLYGSFARTYKGHGTDRALLGGILGFETDDLRIRDSYALAEAEGLTYNFYPDTETAPPHPNTVDIDLVTEEGEALHVQGLSIGGGQAVISRINTVDVELSGNYDSLVVEHWDRPGALYRMTRHLSEARINIAALKLYRESRGNRAYAIIEADETIGEEATRAIAAEAGVLRTIHIGKTNP